MFTKSQKMVDEKGMASLDEKTSKVIAQTTTEVIKHYIDNDKKLSWFVRNIFPGVGDMSENRYYADNWDKGYNRAWCFYCILTDPANSPRYCLFVINTLFSESNGKVLKARIRDKLVSLLGNNIENSIKSYVTKEYANLEKMKNKLLELIDDAQLPGVIGAGAYCYSPGFIRNKMSESTLEKPVAEFDRIGCQIM